MALKNGDRLMLAQTADDVTVATGPVVQPSKAGDRFVLVQTADGVTVPALVVPMNSSGQRGILTKTADGKTVPVALGELCVFGEVLSDAASPSSQPSDMGGDKDIIWLTDSSADKNYELAPSDYSVVQSNATSMVTPTGIGGNTSVIWHCQSGWSTPQVHELDVNDLSYLRSSDSPSSTPYGIGGDDTTILHFDQNTGKIYELDPADFSIVREHSKSTESCRIGGSSDIVWFLVGNPDGKETIEELDFSDFSTVRNAESPQDQGSGIGGKSGILWHCDNGVEKVYKLCSN